MCVCSTSPLSILTFGVGRIGQGFFGTSERSSKRDINWRGFLPVQRYFQKMQLNPAPWLHFFITAFFPFVYKVLHKQHEYRHVFTPLTWSVHLINSFDVAKGRRPWPFPNNSRLQICNWRHCLGWMTKLKIILPLKPMALLENWLPCFYRRQVFQQRGCLKVEM